MVTIELTSVNRIDLKNQLKSRLQKISYQLNKLMREKESLIRIQQQIEHQEQLIDDEQMINYN